MWLACLLPAMNLMAETVEVKEYRHAGPFGMRAPVVIDSTDVNGKSYDPKSLLETHVNLDVVNSGALWSGTQLPAGLNLLSFTVTTDSYFKGSLKMEKAPEQYVLYVDGKKRSAGDVSFTPGSHQAVIKYLSQDTARVDSLQVMLETDSTARVSASSLRLGVPGEQSKRLYTIETLIASRTYNGFDVSPDGRWVISSTFRRLLDGGYEQNHVIFERATGRVVREGQYASWMPASNRYYFSRMKGGVRQLVTVDPVNNHEEVIAEGLPDASFQFTPTEDRLIFSINNEGPKELNRDAFELLHPDDRQPGWRDRNSLAVYDLRTGVMQPLTFGHHSVWCQDISRDGRKLLVSTTESRLTARPTTLTSFYLLDLESMQLDTIVRHDGFVSYARLSPDGSRVLIGGSPEALGGVGKNVRDGQIPSMFDNQLFMVSVADKKVTPLTRDFNPSVLNTVWSAFDNQVYFTAEHRDSICLFRLDPSSNRITMLPIKEDVVGGFSLATHAPVLLYSGESVSNSWRLYSLDLRKPKGGQTPKSTLLQDLNADVMKDVEVCECRSWSFKNSNGDDILCRYYLPNGYDETAFKDGDARLPMIVYYYGGCSPTSRNFEYTYPWTIWASQGYVVLVVEASGASGFGQEFSARHVNTAGVDPARDIIEATKTFCTQHRYVNDRKVGCIGASYGGFMTQYLQTVTDIFACAVSHAGISDHSNYWGYGYWGYSYSEVSMAGSYPWNRKDLYVERSPLYNADKIHTPILFLHGTADTNVPYNNSLQMYTALRLLGREVAMVSIEGENHGIREPKKRVAWHNATMAWFAKWLKDDATWWEALYPKKDL